MNARRLEEAFEECVTAYLEGRRSIEESLSLYPAFAAELAPLLRTAVRLSDSFQKVSPPARMQERGLQRFLADARARRRLRELTAGSRKQSWLASFWGQHGLAFAGAAALVAVLAIAVGSAAMLMGGGGSNGSSVFQTSSATPLRPTPEAVANIQTQISLIQGQRDRGERVTVENLSLLSDATSKLTPSEVQQSIGQVQDVLQAASSLVTDIAASQPEVAPQAQQAQDTIRNVASSLGVALPSTTPAPSETPGATAQPTPVPTSASPTEAPTVAPTPGPTATTAAGPTDTPVERGLPGG